jgi:hypothetical protein
MNRSNTSPRSFSTDQLHAALGDVGGPARPDYLPDIVAQAGRIRQRPAWTFPERWLPMDIAVRRQGVPRAAVVFAALFLLVALFAAGVVYIGSQRTQPERPPGLPTTPGAWERVLIELPSGHPGSVVSLGASPHGLLAVVGEGVPLGNMYVDEAQLAVSTDGRNWTFVPDGQRPSLSSPRSFGYPSVAGTDRGFLMLQLNEIWISENGYDWRRLAGETTDPDLDMGGPDAATAGGPGLVGVGGGNAWYSVDGSDWSVAAVPALPEEILARPDSERYVGMTGVTAAGNDLVSWGIASVPLADNPDEHLVVPLVWTSHDGRTWASVALPELDRITAVTGGPVGFVATGRAGPDAAVWFSADGDAWERVANGAFTSGGISDPGRMLVVESAAATGAGFVVVGGEGLCLHEPCTYQDAVIWTSADGRSWSRVPGDARFTSASASKAISWGSDFLIGGVYGDKAAIWLSER